MARACLRRVSRSVFGRSPSARVEMIPAAAASGSCCQPRYPIRLRTEYRHRCHGGQYRNPFADVSLDCLGRLRIVEGDFQRCLRLSAHWWLVIGSIDSIDCTSELTTGWGGLGGAGGLPGGCGGRGGCPGGCGGLGGAGGGMPGGCGGRGGLGGLPGGRGGWLNVNSINWTFFPQDLCRFMFA